MVFAAQHTVSEWFANSDPIQMALWAVYAFIVLATAIVSAYGVGFISRYLALLFVGDLSRKAVLRIRLIAGAIGAGLAMLFLNPGYIGLGFGPGEGGPPGKGPSVQATLTPKSTSPEEQVPPEPEPVGAIPRPGQEHALRIALLGEATQPPYQPKNRFFAFADDPQPAAVDVEAVMQRVEELKRQTNLREVELVLSPQSTSLQNLEVQRLRRAVEQAGLRFYAPDPESVTAPPKKP